jgi:hypothetical protein
MLVAQLGLHNMVFMSKACMFNDDAFGNTRSYDLNRTWRPPKKTCATTVSYGSDLTQLIRCAIDLMTHFQKEQRGIRVAGV